jgi:hypothetical protein
MNSWGKETGVLCVEDNTSSLYTARRKHTRMERRTDLLFPRTGQKYTSLIQMRKFFTSPVNKLYSKNRKQRLKNAIYKSLFLSRINSPASVNINYLVPLFCNKSILYRKYILLIQIFETYVSDFFVCDIGYRYETFIPILTNNLVCLCVAILIKYWSIPIMLYTKNNLDTPMN